MPPKTTQLATFEEADEALRVLGAAQRELQKLEAAAQAKIDAVKARLAAERIGSDATIKATTKLLSTFILRHRTQIELRGGKTVQLNFGRIGTRTPPASLKFDKGFVESDVIAWLHVNFGKDADIYIQTTERVRRDELKLLEDEQLAKIGCHIDQEDVVVIEPAVDVATAAEVA